MESGKALRQERTGLGSLALGRSFQQPVSAGNIEVESSPQRARLARGPQGSSPGERR